jgi:DNA polymerase-3 subunit delta
LQPTAERVRVQPDKLAGHLAASLAPVYLVSGDEPLQLGECCDAIRSAARGAGYSSRQVFEAGSGFDWNQLGAEAAMFSLFAEKKLLDLRLPGGKPGTEGSRVLQAYCDDPPPDTLLLLTLPKLDRQQQSAKWFKAIEAIGVVLQVWPVEPARLPAWIERRLKSVGIQADRAAVRILADRVEGNLLAARQEIEKLLLLHGPGPLDGDRLAAAVADSARYDVFELVDTAMRGETARALHILEGLRGEGVAAPVVLWALHREIRTLASIAVEVGRGADAEQAIGRARVFSKRVGLVRQALGRLRAVQWLKLLEQCHQADCAIKGLEPQPAWLLLEQAVLGLSGTPPAPAPAR